MHQTRRFLQIATLVGLALLTLPLYNLISHDSPTPTILGRYSRGYFLFLAAYLGIIATNGWISWGLQRVREEHLVRSIKWLNRLRAAKTLYLLTLVAPWFVLIIILEKLGDYAVGQAGGFQYMLLALVLLFEGVILLAGRPSEVAGQTIAKAVLVTVSVALSLGALEFLLRRIPELIPDVARPHLAGGGMFLRRDLVFDKPMQVGYHYRPLLDAWIEFRMSDGDLYRLEADKLQPLAPSEDEVLARLHFVTDENGYPNPSPLQEKYDLVVTGDSFTAPVSVTAAWPQLLGQMTGQSVLNLAMPGYSPRPEAEAVKMFGLAKRPSWVILAYFEGNDLTVEAPGFEAKRSSGLSWVEYDLAREGPYASSAALQSLRHGIPELVERAWHSARGRLLGSESSGSTCCYPLMVSLGDRMVGLAFYDTYLSSLTASRPSIERSASFELVTQALLDLRHATEASDSRLLIVYIPSKEHVYFPLVPDSEAWLQALTDVACWPAGCESADETSGVPLELIRAHLDDQRDVIADFAKQNEIHFLDLTRAFQTAASQGIELYYRADTHWNQDGHLLAAELAANYLARVP